MKQYWLRQLDPNDLALEAPPLQILELGTSLSIDEAADFMCNGGPMPPQASGKKKESLGFTIDNRPPKKYWKQIKKEICLLICTNDIKYKKLRDTLDKTAENNKGKLTFVVAAGLGEALGLQAASITGLVAIGLYAAVKLHKETYCSICLEEST